MGDGLRATWRQLSNLVRIADCGTGAKPGISQSHGNQESEHFQNSGKKFHPINPIRANHASTFLSSLNFSLTIKNCKVAGIDTISIDFVVSVYRYVFCIGLKISICRCDFCITLYNRKIESHCIDWLFIVRDIASQIFLHFKVL